MPYINAVPEMTSNTAPSGVASAKDEYSASYLAFKAFDGDETDSSFWRSATEPPQWIKYDFGSGNGKIIVQIMLRGYSGDTNYSPHDFTFEGSNNDSDWTVLSTQTGQALGSLTTFTFSNTSSYRYYRLNISAVAGSYPSAVLTAFRMNYEPISNRVLNVI